MNSASRVPSGALHSATKYTSWQSVRRSRGKGGG